MKNEQVMNYKNNQIQKTTFKDVFGNTQHSFKIFYGNEFITTVGTMKQAKEFIDTCVSE